MPTNVAEADAKVRLAEFPRRNRETGAREAIRIELADYQGHEYLHVRLWFEPRGGGEMRPTKTGVTLRESELDALAEAVERARAIVHQAGRSTASEPARACGRQVRPDSRHSRPDPSRTPPPWQDHDADDLPY